jgi:hypothetical protein
LKKLIGYPVKIISNGSEAPVTRLSSALIRTVAETRREILKKSHLIILFMDVKYQEHDIPYLLFYTRTQGVGR